MLSYYERKARLPFGAITRTAERCGVGVSTVTAVCKGVHRNRRVELALAAVMTPRTPVGVAFGPGFRMMRRALAVG